MNTVEIMAEAYMLGAQWGIQDDGDLLLLVPDGGLPGDLVAAARQHVPEITDVVLTGIRQSLDGYQPALPGMHREVA